MTTLIGGDWGTSNLRLFRFDAGGAVLETREAARGVLAVTDGGFEAELATLLGDWLDSGRARILLSGMIGSRQGWREAPYVACPADAAAIALQSLAVASALGEIRILPGVQVERGDGCLDVMRGEETQIFGVTMRDGGAQLVVTPGTHSKWVRVKGGRIVDFATYMTGELYALLKTHSILGRLIEGDAHDDAAFAAGVQRALDEPALSKLLFSARSEGLFGRIAPTALSAYLSGLLVGAEVQAALRDGSAGRVTVIATPQLARNYLAALALAGIDDVEVMDGAQASAAGLWQLATAIPWAM
ncbi:2-dehydro-3-deoxygalactonokinase [Solilutibacter silvestris]|uniref:2-keto-3-deoxy-galactonokinase n=1 Tax=Solilutibacter silvestris TaxID=1645665 RepID=A0A2K1Q0H3_9GAMM|nr:2-dehydro-3-deoxygalactonokinase [Lysobacter silvestris]PNS08538.1 2-keto-3-deoxy-galactonokinase [Lysobacter silvestris]